MIIVLFGQPHSGKSTLANILAEQLEDTVTIDGDAFREVFKNKDFTKEGRIKNLTKACDIGYYLVETGIKKNLIFSMVFPYREVRDYLRSLMPEAKFFHLTYDTPRGREKFHVEDFELDLKEDCTYINTETLSIRETVNLIKENL
jgi:adenylylsulfate kinase-like enzyme